MVVALALLGAAGIAVVVRAVERDPAEASPQVTASPTPSPGPTSPAATPTEAVEPPKPPLSSLRRGPEPAIGYVDDGTYRAPDGSRTELPTRYGISSVAQLENGFLVADTRFFEGTNGLLLVEPGSRDSLGRCTSGGGAVSSDRRSVAWATFACPESDQDQGPTTIHRRSADGIDSQVITVEPDSNALTSVAGFLGDEVVFTRAFGTSGTFITDLESAPRRVPKLGGVGGIDEHCGLIAGAFARDYRVSGVVDSTTGTLSWSARHYYLCDFSPDGSLLLGQSKREWQILDAATGEPVATVFASWKVKDIAWEDRKHLLAVVERGGRQAIVRTTLGGSLSLAGQPVPRDTGAPTRFILDGHP